MTLEEAKKTIEYLWDLLDDIDTVSDIAKEDDKLYRRLVESHQRKRFDIGITCDGYELNFENLKQFHKPTDGRQWVIE